MGFVGGPETQEDGTAQSDAESTELGVITQAVVATEGTGQRGAGVEAASRTSASGIVRGRQKEPEISKCSSRLLQMKNLRKLRPREAQKGPEIRLRPPSNLAMDVGLEDNYWIFWSLNTQWLPF